MKIVTAFVIFLVVSGLHASEKTATAKRIKGEIKIDGILSEDEWSQAKPVKDFVQKDPVEGVEPLEPLEVKFLYDDDALYVGAKMYRENLSTVDALVTRRDEIIHSERIIISLDPYNNKKSAYSFVVTASGSIADYYHPSDHEMSRDYSYDLVWEGDAGIDSTGWTAEFRIPFSQLRFNESHSGTWGLNINQWTPSRREDIYWVMIPKDETGWSSKFGKLDGIEGISGGSHLEILPYVTSSLENNPDISGENPYRSVNEFGYRAGLDLKYGISPNFTLDAAINPDFGQVEADPAEVNLTAYETFFEERRPFFTEGNDLLSGGIANYFYSRRIGGAPSRKLSGEFTDNPSNTGILGAAKLTGRTNSGLSIGALSALTNEETAKSTFAGNETEKVVEPMTSYNLVRLQQEFGSAASTVGLIVTAVERFIEVGSELRNILPARAYSGGADWNIRFDGGDYEFRGHAGFSHVSGSKQVITNLQKAPARLYQRPDAAYVSVDSTAESLSGYTYSAQFSKNAGRHWLWSAQLYVESPGFEINDIGSLRNTDEVSKNFSLTYRENLPGSFYHTYRIRLTSVIKHNFGGVLNRNNHELNLSMSFPKRSSAYISGVYAGPSYDQFLTRGSYSVLNEVAYSISGGYSSDWTRDIIWDLDYSFENSEMPRKYHMVNTLISYRPPGRFSVSLSPGYYYRKDAWQYLSATVSDNNSTETVSGYVFGNIEQKTLSAQLRLNYAFTPKFTVELYAEPFVSNGTYSEYSLLEKGGTNDRIIFGKDEGTEIWQNEEMGNNRWELINQGKTYTISDPDFNYLSFRSNLVIRWEWAPGSTLFFIWQQNRDEYEFIREDFRFSGLAESFGVSGINSFAVKVNYWLPVDLQAAF
jgi:hypothetical protein